MGRPLYSYEKVWKVEKKIYAFQNLRLPVPIVPAQLGYFVAIFIVVSILDRVFPPFTVIPPVLKYLALPFALTQFLIKKKLDGKNPIKFLIDYIIYLFTRTRDVEFFRATQPEARDTIKLDWRCSCREL